MPTTPSLRRIMTLAAVLLSFSWQSYAAYEPSSDNADVTPTADEATIASKNSEAVLGMVTGSKTGTYIEIGRDIAAMAQKDGLTINVYESKGSIDNIKRITSKEKVGLAIVQSDVLGFLSRSKKEDSINTARKLRLVAPLYNEEVHILARDNIKTLADLAGKRVVVGQEGSGSMITAVNIFSILGIMPGKMYEIDPADGIVAVLNNDVDAIVFVGGKPVKIFKNMEDISKLTGPNAGKLKQVHFVPITDPRLLKEYKVSSITHNDYDFVTSDVPTIAVTALLITYDYSMRNNSYYHAECRNMAVLAKALRDHLGELKENGHPKWKEVDLNADVINWKRDSCSADALSGDTLPANDNDSGLEKDLLGVIRGKSN
jgi:TRAP transporter TAXI family solute receptor